MLVIIPCGNKKSDSPQRAEDLYIGGYFKACLRFAKAVTTPDRIRILSAKYGLLELDRIIAPYNLHMIAKSRITKEEIEKQAIEQGLQDESNVIIAAGSEYAKVALQVWTDARWILKGVGGIGKQIQFLKIQTEKVKNVSKH